MQQDASGLNGKAVRFRSAAERKVSKLLRQIEGIEHLSRRSSYEFTSEQVAQMFTALHARLDTAELKFAPQVKEKAPPATFTFAG